MTPRRDDLVAKEEIFDGTMQKLFDFVMSELASSRDGKDVGEILKSIPCSYFELYLLYQHHNYHHVSSSIREDDNDPLAAVSAYLEWRQKLQLQFNPIQVQAVLGGGSVGALEMYRLMPECTLGRDKARQPVLYFLFTRRDPDRVNNMVEIMKHVTTKHIFDYHLWQHEALVELCYFCSGEENRVVSSCTLVMDIDLLTTENASSEFLHIASRRADLLSQHFPYLISKILVVNANEQDHRLIRQVRELCSKMAPTATVFFSNTNTNNNSRYCKSADEMLAQHIDISELPAEYGGSHRYSLATLPHPFMETIQLREAGEGERGRTGIPTSTSTQLQTYTQTQTTEDARPRKSGDGGVGGRVSPLLSLHLSLPAAASSVPLPPPATRPFASSASASSLPSSLPPLASSQTTVASSTSTNTSLQHACDEEDSLYPPPSFTPSYLTSVDSHSSRTFSSSSSKVPSNFFTRSLSLSSPGGGGGGGGGGSANPAPGGLLLLPRADDVLTSIPMNSNARVALTAFVELFASNDIPITPADMQGGGDDGCSEEGVEGREDMESENVVLTTAIDPNVFSVIRDGATLVSVGCDLATSLDFMRNITTSFYDTVAVKTSSGVAVLQKRQGDRLMPINCRKYQGSFALASGRVYVLSRGVSLSGWLQKYPMKSQAWGGATQRFFVLNSTSLRYWKAVPVPLGVASEGKGKAGGAQDDHSQDDSEQLHRSSTSTADSGLQLEPCKGQIALSHETIVRRAKTLFGTNTIEIKSKDDTLTLCAYTATEDVAWFSELFNAVEKLKKAHRDVTAGSERNFPELTWRSKEPSCVALDVDVCDPTTVEDKERDFRTSGAKLPPSSGQAVSFGGTYAVLCRVKNGLSTVHSVQIGPHHHIPLRLENSDLDLGVQLSAVRLCGDCLVVSGSHGFVGSGRIPSLDALAGGSAMGGGGDSGGATSSASSSSSSSSASPSQRIYVRRMVNCFHGEDAHVTCLAIPRVQVTSKTKTKVRPKGRSQSQVQIPSPSHSRQNRSQSQGLNPSQSRGNSNSSGSTSSPNILASGDEIGGVCVWRREEGGRGVLHYPTYDGQQSKNKHRGGYSWQCVHRARIGHNITALSFSPDGKILAVTTPERALLFDISQLLVDATPLPQDRRTRSIDSSSSSSSSSNIDESDANLFAIKSVVLDDLVGCTFSNCLLSYGVDLSAPGWVKVWKISSGSESRDSTQKGDKIQFMESRLDSLFCRLRNVKYVKPLRDLFPNSMAASGNSGSNSNSSSDNKQQLGRVGSPRKLISLSQDEMDHCASDVSVENNNVNECNSVDNNTASTYKSSSSSSSSDHGNHHKGSSPTFLSMPPLISTTSAHAVIYTSNYERDCSVLDGYSVDPFYYSDLCVIDPVRMHLRDWWCDYSSRYLLLGHARLSSLSTFESSISASTSQNTNNNTIAGSLSSLSRTINDSSAAVRSNDPGPIGSGGGEDIQHLEAGRGLDRQSTTMFWSTLTNSLGRRVICRYYVPHGYYQRLRHCRQVGSNSGSGGGSGGGSALGIATLLEDCLRFCLTLSRCLYECLGDEYTQALLISWKAVALDSVREILERKCHTVFKDISIFQEVLKRFELSPDLALSSLNDLISVMENIKQWEANQLRQAKTHMGGSGSGSGTGCHHGPESGSSSHCLNTKSATPPPSLTSPLTSLYVETFFKNLRDTLSVVYDEQGLQCIIPSSRMIYLRNGGIPPLNSPNFQQVVNDYMAALAALDVHSSICSIVHLLQSLVIDPLNHFERTEPFAVALCVVGLKGVPAYINDIIMAQQQAETTVAPTVSGSSPPTVSVPPCSTLRRNTLDSCEQSSSSSSHNNDNNLRPETLESVVHKDISIESLISKLAKETPPWIRFVLTSDTDKVLHP